MSAWQSTDNQHDPGPADGGYGGGDLFNAAAGAVLLMCTIVAGEMNDGR